MFFAYNFPGLLFYFITFVVFLSYAYLFNKVKLTFTEKLYAHILLILFVLSYLMLFYLRDFNAPDNVHYIKIFERFSRGYEIKESVSLDIGYVLWSKILATIGVDSSYIVDINASVIVAIFLVSLYLSATTTISFGVMVFMLLTSWSILDLVANTQRQGLSLSLVALAFAFRHKGYFKSSILFVFISATMHWTGYIYVLLLTFSWLFKFLDKKLNWLLYLSFSIFLIALVFPKLHSNLVVFLSNVIGGYIAGIGVLAKKLAWYTSTGVSISPLVRLRIALEFIGFGFLCCWFFNKNKYIINIREFSKLRFEVAAVFLIAGFVTWSEFAFRIYSLFIPYVFVIISILFSREIMEKRGMYNTRMIIFISFFYLLSHLTFWRSGILFYMYGE